jgi:hypothetical protein
MMGLLLKFCGGGEGRLAHLKWWLIDAQWHNVQVY